MPISEEASVQIHQPRRVSLELAMLMLVILMLMLCNVDTDTADAELFIRIKYVVYSCAVCIHT